MTAKPYATVALPAGESMTDAEREQRAAAFAETMAQRRTVRDFAPTPVPRAIIEQCLRAAGTAPSGANQQPWRFVAVSDPNIKHRIREAAEAEERSFYEHRAPEQWLEALAPLGTDADKPFLDVAPWLIAVFYERFALDADGNKHKRYYPHESVGLATGLLIVALHQAGLATLTHTPSPMGFLNEILERPRNEMAYLLLVAGHPAEDCRVPDIERLPLQDYTRFM
ncbi:nitroreductase family protein [Oleiagrimonas sp. MCCC 1A03011]|uniref:nitroreductase family protein n=1 Tax=Oleiagrimonas sp. MCCC 1A03011 TaxID=1926883 RepID=UPI000DC3EC85|nr:nitroreductase family protein [Oleiagrimonas sp. MCCC 1A03011]RAP57709.1 nitroreductase family protein [Oleiagrimonas sp. MCCC 1A03011]